MDEDEGSGTGCQVFGIPIGLMVLAVLAVLANLIVDARASRGPRPARR